MDLFFFVFTTNRSLYTVAVAAANNHEEYGLKSSLNSQTDCKLQVLSLLHSFHKMAWLSAMTVVCDGTKWQLRFVYFIVVQLLAAIFGRNFWIASNRFEFNL